MRSPKNRKRGRLEFSADVNYIALREDAGTAAQLPLYFEPLGMIRAAGEMDIARLTGKMRWARKPCVAK